MLRQSLFSRLHHGRLDRGEQSLVGGIAGLVCGLLLCGATILTSPVARGPNALSHPVTALVSGMVGAAFGVVIGALAKVHQSMSDLQETCPAHSEGQVIPIASPTETFPLPRAM